MASPNRYVSVVVLAADVRCGAIAEQNRRSSALRASREIEYGVHEIDLFAASRPPRPLEASERQALVCVCDRRCRVLWTPDVLFAPRAAFRPTLFLDGFLSGPSVPSVQVGIWLGKHKYMARSCDANTYYERSFEGSCCVFVVTVITVIMVFTVRTEHNIVEYSGIE